MRSRRRARDHTHLIIVPRALSSPSLHPRLSRHSVARHSTAVKRPVLQSQIHRPSRLCCLHFSRCFVLPSLSFHNRLFPPVGQALTSADFLQSLLVKETANGGL